MWLYDLLGAKMSAWGARVCTIGKGGVSDFSDASWSLHCSAFHLLVSNYKPELTLHISCRLDKFHNLPFCCLRNEAAELMCYML